MPGDLVFGDAEGVYFIPPALVEPVVDNADVIHIHDEWTRKKFDEGKYKSSEIYGTPRDPALKKEYDEYLKKRLEELRRNTRSRQGMHTFVRLASLLVLTLAWTVSAQEEATLDGRPVRILSSDKLALTIRSVGGSMVQLFMKDDPGKLNPLEGLGHFVCVDGFGSVSPEERAAGLPGHGEAYRVPWELRSAERKDGTLTVVFATSLPLVQENFRRTIRMVDGESVIHIETELESLLGFDRPVNWAEHATIGGPFLEQGKTVTEMSATRGMTRSHESQATSPPEPHQLADFKEFTWPMAPTRSGGLLDMRVAPVLTPVLDHTTSLMDPSRRLVFITAFHPDRQALLGTSSGGRNTPGPRSGLLSRKGTAFLARPRVRHAAVRRAAARGDPDECPLRHTDLPMAAR